VATQTRRRRRRSDGERSRSAILRAAGQLATVEGLEGLSIARLAEAVGMSKSGLFAHFGSKEELQLATIDAANELFVEHVVEPASEADGLERLRLLAENFLRYVEGGVFPGGCFFASVAAEMDTRPGPVRDRAVQLGAAWHLQLVKAARDAGTRGELHPSEEPEQLAFEVNGFLLIANLQFVVRRTTEPIERARKAVERRLATAAAALT
jgi:AcrR family transcriptional regulator